MALKFWGVSALALLAAIPTDVALAQESAQGAARGSEGGIAEIIVNAYSDPGVAFSYGGIYIARRSSTVGRSTISIASRFSRVRWAGSKGETPRTYGLRVGVKLR